MCCCRRIREKKLVAEKETEVLRAPEIRPDQKITAINKKLKNLTRLSCLLRKTVGGK